MTPLKFAPAVLAVLALATVAPVSAQAWTPAPDGTRTAALEYGYPYPAAPDCVETPGVTTGCVRDKYRFYQGQCVSWVAHRLNTINGVPMVNDVFHGKHWGSANAWGGIAQQVGYRVDQTPAKGAVAWYSRGHVAYVEQVNADGSLLVSEMNHDNHNAFRFVLITKASRWPSGFIHFKDLPAASPTIQYRTDREGLLYTDQLSTAGEATAGTRVGMGWNAMGLVTQVEDLNNDRVPDLLAMVNATGEMRLYPSAGRGQFGTPVRIGTGWGGVSSITDAGHVDGGTSRRLIARYRSGTVISFRLTRGGFSQPVTFTTSAAQRVIGAGDVTGDGRSDVLMDAGPAGSTLLPGTATGVAGAPRSLPAINKSQAVSHQRGMITFIDDAGRTGKRSWTGSSQQVLGAGRYGQRLA